ncbi:MAG: FAD-dependent oxidoreductase [Burkholderiales bacterium]|nr:FAD-dependent oxidoreductase [Burkholderiales bacterium]
MRDSLDLIVIGTGIAGLAAARQARQLNLGTLTFEPQFFGGLVINVNHLDGEIEGSGSELAASMMMEIADLGAQSVNAAVNAIDRDGDLLAVHADGEVYRARAVIVASGARLKRLGVPGEADFIDRGVSQCADCDGPLYGGKDVVVVGGGDSALQEAMVLAGYVRQVHLVHRRETFRARQQLVDQLAGHANIAVHWNTEVEAVLGTQGVEGVRVRTSGTAGRPANARDIACAGLFAYVGLEPECGFVPAAAERDADGRLITDARLRTTLPGIYAAGAVRSGHGGMLSHAIADGVAAATAVKTAIGA